MQKSLPLSLEKIARESNIILVDNNIIGTIFGKNENEKANKFQEYLFDEHVDHKLDLIADYFSTFHQTLKDNENIATIPEVINEFRRLSLIAKRHKKTLEKNQKKLERINRQRRRLRRRFTLEQGTLDKVVDNTTKMRRIVESMGKVDRKLRARYPKVDKTIYSQLLKLSLEIADNIHLFSNKNKHALKYQGNAITDEALIATSFSIPLQGQENCAIITNDQRMASITIGMYDMLFLEDFFPDSERIIDALGEAEIKLYDKVRNDKLLFSQREILPRGITFDSLYEKVRNSPRAIMKLERLYEITGNVIDGIKSFVPEIKKENTLVKSA